MSHLEGTVQRFSDWLRLLQGHLAQFGFDKNLAFAASCCERALPNYEKFSTEVNWGASGKLREALDLSWSTIMPDKAPDINSHAQRILAEIEVITPDTENFRSCLTSAALDAATSIAEVLNYMSDSNRQHILTVASLAQDTIDHFIQCTNNFDGLSDKDVENRIANDPLVIAELMKQQSDINSLKASNLDDPEILITFRRAAKDKERGNLGI